MRISRTAPSGVYIVSQGVRLGSTTVMREPIRVRSAEGAPALASEDGVPRRRSEVVAGLICVALSVAASALFLPHQSLWVDEIDQMGGLTLDPIEVVSWLAGWTKHDEFVIGLDCMPPVSYWVGWLWSKAFGLGEVQLRWLGVTCVGLSTLVVFQTAKQAWGLAPGVAAGLLFALSPNVIATAVTIRAYPLFLLASAATFFCLTRLLADPFEDRPGWLVGMAVCGLIAVYTHFFGSVLIGGCLLATLIIVSSRGGRIGPVLLVTVVVGLVSSGLSPFALASIKAFSRGGGTATTPSAIAKATNLARMFYRLFSGPSMSVSPIAPALAFLGVALAGVSCLVPKRRSNTATTGLMLAWLAGVVVVTCTCLFQSTFAAASPSYNLWMLPAFILLLSSGLAARSRNFRHLAWAGVILLSTANLYGAGQLAINGDYFANSPHRQIRAMIRSLGTDKVAVIHDGKTWDWDISATLRHSFGGAVPQYAYHDGGSKGVRVVDFPERRAEADPTSLSPEYLIVIQSARLRTAEVVDQLRHGIRPIAEGPVARSLAASTRWVPVEEKVIVSFIAVKITLFQQRARSGSGAHMAGDMNANFRLAPHSTVKERWRPEVKDCRLANGRL